MAVAGTLIRLRGGEVAFDQPGELTGHGLCRSGSKWLEPTKHGSTTATGGEPTEMGLAGRSMLEGLAGGIAGLQDPEI